MNTVRTKYWISRGDHRNYTTNQTQDNDSVTEKLKELKSIFDEELITQEEYDAKRKEILDDM